MNYLTSMLTDAETFFSTTSRLPEKFDLPNHGNIIQSLRAFRRPFFVTKWARWVVGSKRWRVGGSVGQGGSRKQARKARVANKGLKKGCQSAIGHPKGLLFAVWGGLGGSLWRPRGAV